MAFVQRIINLQFHLGKGDFGEAGTDSVELTGLRCSVNIAATGTYQTAELRVWGMTLDLMNKLTVLNRNTPGEIRQNTVTVLAGDNKDGLSVCFAGTIQEAWTDGRDPPDVVFHVLAYSALFKSAKIIPPTSFKGSADVGLILSGIAKQIGYQFENSGVTGQLSNPYYPGDARAQFRAICRDINCRGIIDDATHTVAVWPKNGKRNGQIVNLSPETGMMGYPSFTQAGIQVRSIYNPNITFGRAIEVTSQMKAACGQWVVAGLNHYLDANVPSGQWMTEIECGYFGHKP